MFMFCLLYTIEKLSAIGSYYFINIIFTFFNFIKRFHDLVLNSKTGMHQVKYYFQ